METGLNENIFERLMKAKEITKKLNFVLTPSTANKSGMS